jgi:hypothetical protein
MKSKTVTIHNADKDKIEEIFYIEIGHKDLLLLGANSIEGFILEEYILPSDSPKKFPTKIILSFRIPKTHQYWKLNSHTCMVLAESICCLHDQGIIVEIKEIEE